MMQLNSSALKVLSRSVIVCLLTICCSCERPPKESSPSPTTPVAKLESINAKELKEWIGKQQGKLVLVDYWATWCVPCVEKFPKVILLEEKYRDRGLVVLAVNMNEASDMETVSKFLDVYKPSFTQKMAKGKTSEAFEDFDLESLPTYRLHQINGDVIKTYDGGVDISEIEAAIADFVKQ